MTSRQSTTTARPLRVAFLTPSLHIGGAERWILSLARNFERARPAGVVLCAPHYHPDVLEQAARLMPVYVVRKLGDPGETRRLLQRACADADVLITWGVPRLEVVTRNLVGRFCKSSTEKQLAVGRFCKSSNQSTTGGRFTKSSYIPVVDVSHSDGAWEQQTRMVRRAAAGADFHVAVSRCALDAFPADVRERATVIYNGVEVDRVTPRRGASQQRRAWGVGESDKVALFLGRYDDVKGPMRLLNAAEHLPDEWKIAFHGHGPLEKELRRRSRTRESSEAGSLTTSAARERTRVLPPVSQVGDVLAAADVFVMPSRYEGMPLALVEAWLAGTPTVTTPLGFVKEAEAMHGPLCEVVPQNPTGPQLADGIVRSLRNPHSAIRTQTARRVAWENYTAAAMAQRWEEYLDATVASFNRAPEALLDKTSPHETT